jgi:hypothetical protein
LFFPWYYIRRHFFCERTKSIGRPYPEQQQEQQQQQEKQEQQQEQLKIAAILA